MSVTINGYLSRPHVHVLIFLAISLAVFFVLRPKDANSLYSMAGVVYAVFILANSILIFYAPNTWSYFFTSLLFSLVYLLAIALMASMYIHLAKVEGSGESAMVFLVVMYHPLALLFMIFLKWIISKV